MIETGSKMNNVVHWRELNGNKFLTKFVPEMLCPEGYALRRKLAISRRTNEIREVYVIFDKDYVLEVLKSQFELLECDIDTAHDLATESMLLLETQRIHTND